MLRSSCTRLDQNNRASQYSSALIALDARLFFPYREVSGHQDELLQVPLLPCVRRNILFRLTQRGFAMDSQGHSRRIIRFGTFQADLDSGELFRDGLKVRLPDQQFRFLATLLERPGEIVSRDEMRRRLWPDDTNVDFDRSLNTAACKLRDALGDGANHSCYIETIPKKGYRFIALLDGQAQEGRVDTIPITVPSRERNLRNWIAAGVTLATACAIAPFVKLNRPEPAFWDAVPLTAFRGIEANPAVSPDGNLVAFTWNGEKEDNFDIYVMPIQSGSALRLTTDPAEDVSPAWSPDGRTIAFLRRLGDDRGALLLVSAGGGPEHEIREIRDLRLREPPGRFVSLAWSPDGRWIAASYRESEGSGEGLHLISTTGESRQLTAPRNSFGDHMPAFSPDCRALAFCRLEGYSASEIFILPLRPNFEPAREARRLTAHKEWSASPVWTSDARTVLYEFRNEIRTVDVADPQAPPRRIPLSDVSQISLSRHLVYSRLMEDTNIWRAKIPVAGDPPGQPELFITSTREEADTRYSS
jgi:DNA-binding winged helix-turn-helix (wHTH) protein